MKRLALVLPLLFAVPVAARADEPESLEAQLERAKRALAEVQARIEALRADRLALAEAERVAADRARAAAEAARVAGEAKRAHVVVLDGRQSDEEFEKAVKALTDAHPGAVITRKDGFVVIQQGGTEVHTDVLRIAKPRVAGVVREGEARWLATVPAPPAPPAPPTPPTPPTPPPAPVAPVKPVEVVIPVAPMAPVAPDGLRESVRALREEVQALREDLRALREALKADAEQR
jgi:hypothetical protein